MIRRLGPGDASVLRQIRREALVTTPDVFASAVSDFDKLDDAELERRIAANATLVALDGDDPVGLIGLLRQNAPRMSHRAALTMVFLRETHRGRGLARALVDAATKAALDEGITHLELAVTVENEPARQFYHSLGFEEVGRIPDGFRIDDRLVDEILMCRRIAP